MKFLSSRFKEEEELTINITNMIDVIFILLIFFMISTQFKKANIFMDLPQVEDSVSVTMQEVSANLAVNQNEIELEGKIIAPEALEEELLKMLETNPKLTILFSADKNINYERFLEIYVKLEKAGIERILIEHETLAD